MTRNATEDRQTRSSQNQSKPFDGGLISRGLCAFHPKPPPLGAGGVVLGFAGLVWMFVALRVASPLVLADEYVYVMQGVALDTPHRIETLVPSLPIVGNVLFLRLINLVSRAHLPIETTVKIFNVACFVTAAHICGRMTVHKERSWRSIALFAISAILPLGSYVAYVMPESLYFLIFVSIFALLLNGAENQTFRLWAAAGGLLALLTLCKAHGIFVAGAFFCATVAWSIVTGRIPLITGSKLCLLAGAVFGLVLIFGMRVLGPWSPGFSGDFIGGFYWAMVKRSAFNWSHVATIAQFAGVQLSSILLLLAPAMTFLAWGILSDRRDKARLPGSIGRFSFLAIFLLTLISIVLLVVSIMLNAEPNRIQLRYISFVFICVLILSWSWMRATPSLDTRSFRMVSAILWASGAIAFVFQLPHLRPLAADAPEIFFSYQSGEFGDFGLGQAAPWVAGSVVLFLSLALLHPKIKWFDLQIIALVVLFSISDFNTIRWQGLWSATQGELRKIGEVAKVACGSRDADLMATGPYEESARLYTAMAGVGRPLRLQLSASGAGRSVTTFRAGCVITPLDFDETLGSPLIQAAEMKLYRSSASWRVQTNTRFDAGLRPAMLAEGWSGPEPGGIWTDGSHATLALSDVGGPSPAIIAVDAFSYHPPGRTNQRVLLSANGKPLKTWLIDDGVYLARLPRLPASTGPITIRFDLPDATAPASVVPDNADHRRLAIAVRSVTLLRQDATADDEPYRGRPSAAALTDRWPVDPPK